MTSSSGMSANTADASEIEDTIEYLAALSSIDHLPREDQVYAAEQYINGEELGDVTRRIADWISQYQMEIEAEDAEALANERDYQ